MIPEKIVNGAALRTGRLERTMLMEDIRSGIPKPDELETGVLLKGRVHQLFAGSGKGKSWLALRFAVSAMERGETVLYLDMENGKRIITERLQALGVGDDVDDLLYYCAFPSLDMSDNAREDYESLLDTLQPDLIVFDSWVNFLAASGMDEDSNSDVEKWSNAYIHPARTRGCTIVLLDHVPHEGSRSRGASRKKDMVDVQWKLTNPQRFDRGTVGRIDLKCEKDREGWFTQGVSFAVGGTPEGFICERSTASRGLPDSAKAALQTLEEFGEQGAQYGQWRESIPWRGGLGMPDTTFRNRAIKRLTDDALIIHEGGRYYRTPVL